MISEQDKKEIVARVSEKMLKILPELVINIITVTKSNAEKINTFVEDNPGFEKHPEIVGQMLSKIEGKDPTVPYDRIMQEAVPEIQKAIRNKRNLSMDPVADKDSLDLSHNLIESDHGML